MSSSIEDLHPGFTPGRNDLSPITPTSPFGNFTRKRSYPVDTVVREHTAAEMAAEDTGSPRGFKPASATHSSRHPVSDVAIPASCFHEQHGRQQPHSPTTTTNAYAAEPAPGVLGRQLSNFTFASEKASGIPGGTFATPQYEQSQHHMQSQMQTPAMAATDGNLDFWQRHFTKPVKNPEVYNNATNRRFAFTSHGSIIAATAMLVLLLGVVAAAVAVTMDHQHVRAPLVSTPSGQGGQGGQANPGSPIRAAIFDNFPDPQIWYTNGTYYAFATNNAAGILNQTKAAINSEYGTSNVQLATSTNFVDWTLLTSSHDPLPTTGAWVTRGMSVIPPSVPKSQVWAPGIIQRPTDNKFVLYYAAHKASLDNGSKNAILPGRHPAPHCIGAAVSETDDPAGPYTPEATALACHLDGGGAIDPAAFQDHDGTLWLTYKVDGNNIGHGGICGNTKAPIVPTPIMLQKMLPDGITPDGNYTVIMDRMRSDGPLVEAPALVRSHEGIYFLFFSSGCTRSPSYDIKYATALNITGPYRRAQYPLLESGDYGLLAPGSASVHDDGNGGFDMAFHARVTAPQGRIRAMFTTKLEFNGHVVTMVRANDTVSADAAT